GRYSMKRNAWTGVTPYLIGAALFAVASLASAQPTWGNPSPTAGKETSQKANAAADQTIYQPVTYTNAAKKGPAVDRHPREIQTKKAQILPEVKHRKTTG